MPGRARRPGRFELIVRMEDSGKTYEWSVRLVRDGYEFYVLEHVEQVTPGAPPVRLLDANKGEGRWWSGNDGMVGLKQGPTSCGLAAAAADASFPARDIAEFVSRWGFFDPNPFLLRRDWASLDSGRFDPYGRNLAETLHALNDFVAGRLGSDRRSNPLDRGAAFPYTNP